MLKIQFDVIVANGVAIDVANDVQIYCRFSGFKNTPSVFNVLYIKIVLDKTKQLLGLLLTLHRNMSGGKASPSMGVSTRHISV